MNDFQIILQQARNYDPSLFFHTSYSYTPIDVLIQSSDEHTWELLGSLNQIKMAAHQSRNAITAPEPAMIKVDPISGSLL